MSETKHSAAPGRPAPSTSGFGPGVTFRIFTAATPGAVSQGAGIETLTLSGGVEVPALLVGEHGRNRHQGVLPVANAEGDRVDAARWGESRTGRPKLYASTDAPTDAGAIVVWRTGIGFRGGSGHTGDCTGRVRCKGRRADRWQDPDPQSVPTEHVDEHEYPLARGEELPETCPICGMSTRGNAHRTWHQWPCSDLVVGMIADGIAGRMGWGKQRISLLPRDRVARVFRTGRLYGSPGVHYYRFDGRDLHVATSEERFLLDW